MIILRETTLPSPTGTDYKVDALTLTGGHISEKATDLKQARRIINKINRTNEIRGMRIDPATITVLKWCLPPLGVTMLGGNREAWHEISTVGERV